MSFKPASQGAGLVERLDSCEQQALATLPIGSAYRDEVLSFRTMLLLHDHRGINLDKPICANPDLKGKDIANVFRSINEYPTMAALAELANGGGNRCFGFNFSNMW
jgi:hypothetical protein